MNAASETRADRGGLMRKPCGPTPSCSRSPGCSNAMGALRSTVTKCSEALEGPGVVGDEDADSPESGRRGL